MNLLKYLKSFLLILCLLLAGHSAEAQLFGKKKKKTSVSGFTLKESPSPENRREAQQKRMVSPIRKILNGFNFHIEKSFGYFSYQSELTGVSVIRDPSGDLLYMVPIGQEGSVTSPINAYTNWTTDLTPVAINRIDDDSQIVRTDTANMIYKNSGWTNPWVFRLDYSIKKVDKAHLKRTGEKRYLDQDQFRIGGGIGFGSMVFKNSANTQNIDPLLGNNGLSNKTIRTTKLFGSASYNAYSFGDFSIIADVYGGVWKTKSTDINQTLVNYDPFFNVGVMFQTTWSKYFKGYIRPSIEMRSYTLSNDFVSVPHKFNIFSIDLGLILKYPTYPRNKYKADMVQMEHEFNGKMYRGRPFYRKQNPRTGQRRNTSKGSGYKFPIKKN